MKDLRGEQGSVQSRWRGTCGLNVPEDAGRDITTTADGDYKVNPPAIELFRRFLAKIVDLSRIFALVLVLLEFGGIIIVDCDKTISIFAGWRGDLDDIHECLRRLQRLQHLFSTDTTR
jgi:hypothetical protein